MWKIRSHVRAIVLCKLVKGKDQIIIFENVLKYEKFLVSYVLSGVSLEFESQRYPAFLRVKVNFHIVRSKRNCNLYVGWPHLLYLKRRSLNIVLYITYIIWYKARRKEIILLNKIQNNEVLYFQKKMKKNYVLHIWKGRQKRIIEFFRQYLCQKSRTYLRQT